MNKQKTSDTAAEGNLQPSVLKTRLESVFGTTLGTVSATAALVAIHHHYRKQRQPKAQLQDYLTGLGAQLNALPSKQLPLSQLIRLQYAYKQATSAYQNYPNDRVKTVDADYKQAMPDFSALHSTTMLARPVCWVSGVASMLQTVSLTAGEESANGFGVVGIDADRQIVWQTTMPERVHDIVVQPPIDGLNSSQADKASHRHVVVMGRRPSEGFWVLAHMSLSCIQMAKL